MSERCASAGAEILGRRTSGIRAASGRTIQSCTDNGRPDGRRTESRTDPGDASFPQNSTVSPKTG